VLAEARYGNNHLAGNIRHRQYLFAPFPGDAR
jgi:hypothetical protein